MESRRLLGGLRIIQVHHALSGAWRVVPRVHEPLPSGPPVPALSPVKFQWEMASIASEPEARDLRLGLVLGVAWW